MDLSTVLIVDDEEYVRNSFTASLQSTGCINVITASDGIEALELINKGGINLVLTDLKMPNMGGLELLKKLQENHNVIPVVVITGDGDIPKTVEALKLGAINFISKPIKYKELIEVVNRGLQHSRNLKQQIHDTELKDKILDTVERIYLSNNAFTYSCQCSAITPKNLLLEAVIQIFENVAKMGGFRGLLSQLSIIVHEILANAINYGSLEVDSSLRDADDDSFEKAVAFAYKDPKNKNKKVYFQFKVSNDMFTVSVTDEGNGFDWELVPDEFTEESFESSHGRGLVMLKIICNSVRWNKRGTSITITLKK